MHLHPTLDTLLASLKSDGLSTASTLEYHFLFRAADGRQTYRFTKSINSISLPTAKSGPPPTIIQVSSEDAAKPAGPQLISLIITAKLSTAKARKIFDQASALAATHGLEFRGVGCRPPEPKKPYDWAARTNWPTLDQTTWLLRHFASTGQLEFGTSQIELLFPFEGEPKNLSALEHTLETDGAAGAAEGRGIKTKLASNLLFARIACLTDDAVIASHYTHMQQAAAAAGVELKGVELWNPEAEW